MARVVRFHQIGGPEVLAASSSVDGAGARTRRSRDPREARWASTVPRRCCAPATTSPDGAAIPERARLSKRRASSRRWRSASKVLRI